MTRKVVDTSVLVRIVTRDPPDAYEQAMAAFHIAVAQRDILIVHSAVFCEMMFVLSGPRIRAPLDEQLTAIGAVLRLPAVILDRDVIALAAAWYGEGRSGWLDCFIAAFAQVHADANVVSFDRDFDRFPGVTRSSP